MRAGDIVLKRSIYRGNVRWTSSWPAGWEERPPPPGWSALGLPRDGHVV